MDSPCHPYHHFRVQSTRYPWPSLLPASRQSVRHGSTVDALDRRWRPSINQNLCSPASSTRSLWISAVLHTTIYFDEVRKRKPEVHLVMMVSPSQPAHPPTNPVQQQQQHQLTLGSPPPRPVDFWCETESLMRFQFTIILFELIWCCRWWWGQRIIIIIIYI